MKDSLIVQALIDLNVLEYLGIESGLLCLHDGLSSRRLSDMAQKYEGTSMLAHFQVRHPTDYEAARMLAFISDH